MTRSRARRCLTSALSRPCRWVRQTVPDAARTQLFALRQMAHADASQLPRSVVPRPPPRRSLTPVFALRSRAMEYRERVANACIERLCAGAPEPIRYLRRAVELVADTGSRVAVRSQKGLGAGPPRPSPWLHAPSPSEWLVG